MASVFIFAGAEKAWFFGLILAVDLSPRKRFFGNENFELSTGIPTMNSDVYPQEIFMLQCYFLALGAALGNSVSTGSGLRKAVGAQDPSGPERNRRDISTEWVAKVCGPEPESVEILREFGGKVLEHGCGRGVTGNRSVSGRPQGRKHWAHRPLGGKVQEGVRGAGNSTMRGPRLSTWRLFLLETAQEKGSNLWSEPSQRQLMHTASCTCNDRIQRYVVSGNHI